MCDLCKKEKLTKWHWQDDLFWIADCKTCGTPMVVLNEHRMTLTMIEIQNMLNIIELLFPCKKIRFEQRNTKDHLHWHLDD